MHGRASRRTCFTLAWPFASPSTSSNPNRPFAIISVSRCPSLPTKTSWPGWRRWRPLPMAKSSVWWPRRDRWSASMMPLAPPPRWWKTNPPGPRDVLICRTSSNGTRWIFARSSQRPRPCRCQLVSAKITLAPTRFVGPFPGISWWIGTCSSFNWASVSCASLARSWRRWAATWPLTSRWRNPQWSQTLRRFSKRPTVLSSWPSVTWPRTAVRPNSRWVQSRRCLSCFIPTKLKEHFVCVCVCV